MFQKYVLFFKPNSRENLNMFRTLEKILERQISLQMTPPIKKNKHENTRAINV